MYTHLCSPVLEATLRRSKHSRLTLVTMASNTLDRRLDLDMPPLNEPLRENIFYPSFMDAMYILPVARVM
jgi:hypothetical protein